MRLTRSEIKSRETELKTELKKWVYRNGSQKPPSIEEAWIIHSQIAWKGTEATADELWEDMPYTDPALIQFLLEEGEESILPNDTLLQLHKSLLQLEQLGIHIREEFFSLNWEKNKKTHKGGRFLEVRRKLKAYQTSPKERLKPLPPKKEKSVKKKPKKASKSLLLGLFGL
jgi:hypothetical protein